jgi:2-amino-4-hydroxy-6-hydroxymethyldihydropteridine diphosphokinase
LSGRNSTAAYLGLGGNIGDPEAAMAAALRSLDAHPDVRVMRVSSLYRTPPWGPVEQPDFLNAAAQVETVLPVRGLLELCLETERGLKRVRRERWGPRAIDIDILVYGEEAIAEEELEVPHPRMLGRAFVLAPLAEIAPDLRLAGVTAADRLARLDSTGIVRLSPSPDWWRG